MDVKLSSIRVQPTASSHVFDVLDQTHQTQKRDFEHCEHSACYWHKAWLQDCGTGEDWAGWEDGICVIFGNFLKQWEKHDELEETTEWGEE